MRRLLALFAALPLGCSPAGPPTDPEPVPLNRKFFDDPAGKGKARPLPQANPN